MTKQEKQIKAAKATRKTEIKGIKQACTAARKVLGTKATYQEVAKLAAAILG